MDAFEARKVIDVFEKAEKIAQSRPPLPKEILPSYLKILDKIYQLSLKGKVRVSDVSKALHQTTPSITRAYGIYTDIQRSCCLFERNLCKCVCNQQIP